MNTTETANVETAAAEPKAKTATITLRADDGKTTMQICAERRADGARTYVITTDADKKTARGMTENHASFEAAKADIEKIAAKAVKAGWIRPARKAFVAKPDAFVDIPAPPKATTKKEKK
jgi:hypothetical protein